MLCKILFHGNFSKNEVTCRYNPISCRKINPKIENKAKQIWKQTVDGAKTSGKKVWDQPVYRLERFDICEDTCELDFSTIPFSIRSSIKEFTDELVKLGEDFLPMATYSSIFIETTDGNFVFGEKSDKYLTNRKYNYIGGVFNKTDDEINLFRDSIKEIVEELGVNAEKDIEDFKLLGAFRSESCNVGFIFYCKLKLSDNEAKEIYLKNNDEELANVLFVRKEDVRDFVVNKIGKESEMVDIFENFINK